MPTSSDSIGQLAGALAKAQAELVNPPKSLTAILDGGSRTRDRSAIAMRRSPPVSRSCARPSAGMNSPSCRPRISIRRVAGWS